MSRMEVRESEHSKDTTPAIEVSSASTSVNGVEISRPPGDAGRMQSSSGIIGDKQFVERSPQGNYVKFPDILGKGAFKTVYKGQDVNNGWLVAWNEVNIRAYGKKERARIMNEIMLLRTLSHPNLISFYGGWVNKESEKVVFVTELMSSGTLKDFTSKYPIPCKQIKRYAREILECIHYLHTPQVAADGSSSIQPGATASTVPSAPGGAPATPAKPVVIHRDLKCDNIFIQAQGKGIKIGDLGLATTDGRSVMGTPEFMAPEMYETGYSTSVDIYAFGLCLLEMVTGRTPYVECGGVVAIYKRVLAGVLPENIRVLEAGWPEAYSFVLRCLQPLPEPQTRLPALPSISEAAGGDEEESEGDETETEATGPEPSSATATVQDGAVAAADGDPSSAVSAPNSTAQAVAGPAPDSARAGDGALPRRSKPRQYLRPTALDLLQDPFLHVTEEDATRTTWDVRKVAEAKSVPVIVGPEDPNRPVEWPAPQPAPSSVLLEDAPPPALLAAPDDGQPQSSAAGKATEPAVAESMGAPSAVAAVNSDPAADVRDKTTPTMMESQSQLEKGLSIRTADDNQQPNTTSTAVRSSNSTKTKEADRARRAARSSQPSSNSNPTTSVTLQGLAEEVRTLRHWVAQTYGLVEWLVLQQDGGKAFMESRAGRRIREREDKPTAEPSQEIKEADTRRSLRAKSVTFAEPSSSMGSANQGGSSPTKHGSTTGSHHAVQTVVVDEAPVSNSIESVLAGFSATGDDLLEERFSSDVSEGIRMTLSKLRFDFRKEEFKLAKIAAKQVQEFVDNHRRLNEEHADAVSSEQERHRKQVENFEKSRTEILKVLGPIRAKRQKIEEESEVSADEEGLSLRERTEEQMYSRRLDLLIGREADEETAHRDALKTIEDNFQKGLLRYETKEREIRDAFATKIEKIRSDATQAYARALDAAKAIDVSADLPPSTVDVKLDVDKVSTNSPVREEGTHSAGPSSTFTARSPQLLFFSGQEKEEAPDAQSKESTTDGVQASPRASQSNMEDIKRARNSSD